MPEEERGTKVSFDDLDPAFEYINTLICITFGTNIMKIKARFTSHELYLGRLSQEDIKQIKASLVKHNFDNKFEIKFAS